MLIAALQSPENAPQTSTAQSRPANHTTSFAQRLEEALGNEKNAEMSRAVKEEVKGEGERGEAGKGEAAGHSETEKTKEGSSDIAVQKKPVDADEEASEAAGRQKGKVTDKLASEESVAQTTDEIVPHSNERNSKLKPGKNPGLGKTNTKNSEARELQSRQDELAAAKARETASMQDSDPAAAQAAQAAAAEGTEPSSKETAKRGASSAVSHEGAAGEATHKTEQSSLAGVLKAESPHGGKSHAEGHVSKESGRRPALEVKDYRRAAGKAQAKGTAESSNASESARASALPEKSAEMDREGENSGIRLVRMWNSRGEGSETEASRAGRSSSFSNYVRETLNNQIVKQSGIILRNNNRGEIRLVLQPEHLGRVRLRIQLDENRLSGRIFVDSSFVKESFEQNLTSLYRAFKNSGFETSEFEVLVDGGEKHNGADGSEEGSPDGGFEKGLNGYSAMAAKTSQQFDDAVPILEGTGWQSDLVNMVV